MNSFKFLKQGLKNIKTVGTLTRSSKYLCKEVIDPIDFQSAKQIVELGAGDGVITEYILDNMTADAQLHAFEVHPEFCKVLRKLKDPRLNLVEESAEILLDYLKRQQIDQVDYIVSAIPFVALPDELAYDIVNQAQKALKPGGLYMQIHYSLLAKKIYEGIFSDVDINFVPINIPPAFVLVCTK